MIASDNNTRPGHGTTDHAPGMRTGTGSEDGAGPRPSRGAAAITARLRDAIKTGVYANGDQLPPERELAEMFDSARSTVRKALNRLEADGLVARRAGSGTYVNYSGPLTDPVDNITELVSPLQLIEARLGVEPQMTQLAALHASQRDLEAIEAALVMLERSRIDEAAFSRWDAEFHQRLARASRNPLLQHLYTQINEVRTHAQWRAMRQAILSPEEIDAYNRQHRAIFDALRKRDSRAAERTIRDHLDKARRDLLGVAAVDAAG